MSEPVARRRWPTTSRFVPLAESSTAYERICPQRGWYEIDAAELGRAVERVVAECSRQCGHDPIRWLSCSVFGGGISALDAQLRPLLNVISTTDQRASRKPTTGAGDSAASGPITSPAPRRIPA